MTSGTAIVGSIFCLIIVYYILIEKSNQFKLVLLLHLFIYIEILIEGTESENKGADNAQRIELTHDKRNGAEYVGNSNYLRMSALTKLFEVRLGISSVLLHSFWKDTEVICWQNSIKSGPPPPPTTGDTATTNTTILSTHSVYAVRKLK